MKRCLLITILLALVVFQQELKAADGVNPSGPMIYHSLNLVNTELAKNQHNYIDIIFAPLGWSADGKFAYITGKDPGGAGHDEIGFFSWVIQDMVTDKYLWTSKDELEQGIPGELLNQYDEEKIFRWVFTNFIGRYQKNLDKYGVKVDKNLKLLRFPLVYNNCEYRGSIIDTYRQTKYGIPDMLTKYKVAMTKDGKIKVFGQYTDQFLLNVQVIGYIKSPDEPRIALAVCGTGRGWEGPPHPVEWKFIGCHLERGY